MTKEEFHKIIKKPKSECDGCELHLRHCYEHNRWKSIFTITGLDFSGFGGEDKGNESAWTESPTREEYYKKQLKNYRIW